MNIIHTLAYTIECTVLRGRTFDELSPEGLASHRYRIEREAVNPKSVYGADMLGIEYVYTLNYIAYLRQTNLPRYTAYKRALYSIIKEEQQ